MVLPVIDKLSEPKAMIPLPARDAPVYPMLTPVTVTLSTLFRSRIVPVAEVIPEAASSTMWVPDVPTVNPLEVPVIVSSLKTLTLLVKMFPVAKTAAAC